MIFSSPCQESLRSHGTQNCITALTVSQFDPIINTNNQHSHILFVYDALYATFPPSPQLPSDIFLLGVPNKTVFILLSLLHTLYMSYRSHSDLFNRLITIWCTARYTNLVYPYFMISQYAMDWTTRVILPVQVFLFAITFRLALGPTVFLCNKHSGIFTRG